MPAPYCAARGSRPSSALSQQAASSHSSAAGKAPPVTVATRINPSAGVGAWKSVATATTASTNITVRSTTPIWQESKSAAPARAGPRGRVEDGAWGVVDKIDGLRIKQTGCKPIIASQPVHPMTHNQLDKKSEAWSALFSEPMSDLVKRYTASVFFDKRLWQADIRGSLAHAGMLA